MTGQGQEFTTAWQREQIATVTLLRERRNQRGAELRANIIANDAEATQQFVAARREATVAFQARHAQLALAYRNSKEELLRNYECQGLALLRKEQAYENRSESLHADFLEAAKTVRDERLRRIHRGFNRGQGVLEQEMSQFQELWQQRQREAEAIDAESRKIVTRRVPWPTTPPPAITAEPGFAHGVYLDRSAAAVARARVVLQHVRNRPAARFVEDGWPALLSIFFVLLAAYPAWIGLRSYGIVAVVLACLGGSAVIALVIRKIARALSSSQTLAALPPLQAELATAFVELEAARDSSRRAAQRALAKLTKRRDRELAGATEDFDRESIEHSNKLQGEQHVGLQRVRAERAALEATSEKQLTELEQRYPQQIAAEEQAYLTNVQQLAEEFRDATAARYISFNRELQELDLAWHHGIAHFEAAIAKIGHVVEERFPPWPASGLPGVVKPKESISTSDSDSFLVIGHYDFHFTDTFPNAACTTTNADSYSLPVVLASSERPSLLIKTQDAGRDAATAILQNAMLRLLTTYPPGKVRFTIIDPVGLGQNFSAFMHLADFDGRLVTSRIWTEANHINQRLADLSEHMEDVIQKYLRNEFASIQQYNAQAGEVAEPYHILVIANFPANFSDEAARRLVSIATSGARCGVYTLISVDEKQKLPRSFDLADLEAQATTFGWNPELRQFRWKFSDLESFPLHLEAPPADEILTATIREVGLQAKDSARVEVPFESVVAAGGEWWSGDSRQEIEVPLGRAGAKKLQYMRLGRGTSQHVLIAGKTGSGKSTLLNALITNLAIHYSPNELHFYLIDFKKGVEFKAYASLRLPHARVIAIESEREFGLSVLERLDLELKNRGDMLRKAGVQDVKGYRNANPTAEMPRILLVIDEFQEFFTSDDKISHEASLLLDRLVRQGRAFGIHVLLGSQTLAGAYSLARSTIGQMAVRVALQCSESDAHLILSEDNTAARLLNRPGEAIYNDANGLLEGNHPFQVVWLSDQQREGYLRRVSEMAAAARLALPAPIIFEGNVAADSRDNPLFRDAIRGRRLAGSGNTLRAWLGSPVAIKEPTEAIFQNEGGNNLLAVGPQEELAQGVLVNALVALAAQSEHRTGAVPANGESSDLSQFYLLDGSRSDSPEASVWQRVVSDVLPKLNLVGVNSAAGCVRMIAEEVVQRLASPDRRYEPMFLGIFNLARFRDLRKSDDFGISGFSDDDAPAADKQLATILREGPALAVHTIVWCDSYNNLSRWFDRQTLREFKLRVLFQMSATDSSNLIDSPLASRLGAHMAFLFQEDLGQPEKFRPYGIPTSEWMAWIQQQRAVAGEQFDAEQPVG